MSGSRYAPLNVWFKAQSADKAEVSLTFAEIERVIGAPLPRSAHDYVTWWRDASAGITHHQVLVWLSTDRARICPTAAGVTRPPSRQNALSTNYGGGDG